MKSNHIVQLDGLRGIAILLVLFLHFFNYGFLYPYFYFGWVGVDLFFVLSGFLITGILLGTKKNKGYYKTFIIRRALRILPLYYGVLVVFVFISPYSRTTSWFQEYQLFFWTHTSNFLILSKGFLHPLSHFWSLALEEQFYFLWPLVVFILKPKQLVFASLLLIAAGILIRYFYARPYLTFGFPFAHMDGLLFGGISAVLIRQKKDFLFCHIHKIFFVSLVVLLGYLGIYLILFGISDQDVFHRLPFTYTLIALFFCSVLILSLKSKWVANIFATRFLLFFGKYSYGMYVFNSILFYYVNWAGADQLTGNQKLVIYSGAFALTVILSFLSFHLFEVKFLRLKERIGRISMS